TLFLPATNNMPEVRFHAESRSLRFTGESFPENVVEAYKPVRAFLDDYFEENPNAQLRLIFELAYFNTSTSKTLYDIFVWLAKVRSDGADITVEWRYPSDVEVMQEHGEDFADEIELPFVLVPQ
ncbi:MAG: DUF1987 domain-containing protein, partial [Puniceicoccales bacterium]